MAEKGTFEVQMKSMSGRSLAGGEGNMSSEVFQANLQIMMHQCACTFFKEGFPHLWSFISVCTFRPLSFFVLCQQWSLTKGSESTHELVRKVLATVAAVRMGKKDFIGK